MVRKTALLFSAAASMNQALAEAAEVLPEDEQLLIGECFARYRKAPWNRKHQFGTARAQVESIGELLMADPDAARDHLMQFRTAPHLVGELPAKKRSFFSRENAADRRVRVTSVVSQLLQQLGERRFEFLDALSRAVVVSPALSFVDQVEFNEDRTAAEARGKADQSREYVPLRFVKLDRNWIFDGRVD